MICDSRKDPATLSVYLLITARYYFSNEVACNNGVELIGIGRMLEHKSIKTTERYIKANREKISDEMETVEQKLCTEDGILRSPANKRRKD